MFCENFILHHEPVNIKGVVCSSLKLNTFDPTSIFSNVQNLEYFYIGIADRNQLHFFFFFPFKLSKWTDYPYQQTIFLIDTPQENTSLFQNKWRGNSIEIFIPHDCYNTHLSLKDNKITSTGLNVQARSKSNKLSSQVAIPS